MKNKILNIDGKIITLYGNIKSGIPVIYLNTVNGEGQAVWNKCNELGCSDFILAAVSGLNWNSDMTPWYSPAIYKGSNDFEGKAPEYLELLTNKIIPNINSHFKISPSYYTIAGYSLGGLFAYWSLFNTNAFSKCISVSGSLWYPGLLDYCTKKSLSVEPSSIYFSLGNTEHKTKNQSMAKVLSNTEQLYNLIASSHITSTFDHNKGNHFSNPELRMAKGIKWSLEN